MRPSGCHHHHEFMRVVGAHQLGPTEGHDTRPGRDARPRVLVAIDHPTMRALTGELLARDGACRVTKVKSDDQALAAAIDSDHPDLVILDTREFPNCCPTALGRCLAAQVIVIGPEAEDLYRAAALAAGAGAWVARERIGDDLIAEVWRLLCGRPCARR